MKIKTYLSAGVDLTAQEDIKWDPIDPIQVVGTGFKLKETLPQGYYYQLHLRSSLGVRGFKANVGIIDGDYLDEIKVILEVPEFEVIKKGERIAQLICMQHSTHLFFETEKVTRTGGLGSTNQLDLTDIT